MPSKSILSETLEAHSNNLRLASVLRVLARGHDLAASFKEIVGSKSPTAFEPSLLLLKNKRKLVHSADQLYLAMVRTAVTESLELTRDYCRQTLQTKALKAQDWFNVFRLLRNALNHNFQFEFKPDDLKLLPATWRKITIYPEHQGTELTQKILPPDVAIEWLAELDTFISEELQ